MKIKLLFSLLIASFSAQVYSQSQPTNGGFENWTQRSTESPTGFFTTNNMVLVGNGNVTKASDAYHGSFAATLTTVANGQDTTAGMLIIGTPGNGAINGGMPFTGTPDSVTGYIKYNLIPGDKAIIIIGFKKNGSSIGSPAIMTFSGSQSTYIRFSIPTFLSTMNPPDSMVAIISSSNLDPPRKAGNTITIDSITFTNSSQPFPNGDFENWSTVISGVNPTGWSSFNNFTSLGMPELSFKTTDVHSGSYALRLISKTAILMPPFGNGGLDTVGGFVFLGGLDRDNQGVPYTDRPVSMKAFVKGTLPVGGQCIISAQLSKWNSTTLMRDQIGEAMLRIDSSYSNYKLVTIPFNYNLTTAPDSLTLRIMAGDAGPGGFIANGIEYFIDDLAFSFPTGMNETKKEFQFDIFPNPSQGTFTIHTNELSSGIEIFNALGRKIYSSFVSTPTQAIDLSGESKGIYFYRITGAEHTIKSGCIVIE